MNVREETAKVLEELALAKSPAELQALVAGLEGAIGLIGEVMEPNQSTEVTRIELADVFVTVLQERETLAAVGYSAEDVQRLRMAIIAARTYDEILKAGLRFGDWKTRTVAEVVEASRPWRDKLRKAGTLAFFFQPTRAAVFHDHNETRTVEEEVTDLRDLLRAAAEAAAELEVRGFTLDDRREGQRLLTEAEHRDVLAIIGIRSQADATLLRNQYLTLAVLLGRHARAAGEARFWNDPNRRAPFERASFTSALRRVRRGTTRPTTTEAEADATPPAEPTEPTAPAPQPAPPEPVA